MFLCGGNILKFLWFFLFPFFTQVKQSVKSKFTHLKEHQQMLWSHFLTQKGSLYPHMEILIEILLVLQGSSVEWGFSNLCQNLHENCLAMSNEWLNQLLMVKFNLPVLHNLIKDCDNVILNECIFKDTINRRNGDSLLVKKQNQMSLVVTFMGLHHQSRN